jgi:hypothetical protein
MLMGVDKACRCGPGAGRARTVIVDADLSENWKSGVAMLRSANEDGNKMIFATHFTRALHLRPRLNRTSRQSTIPTKLKEKLGPTRNLFRPRSLANSDFPDPGPKPPPTAKGASEICSPTAPIYKKGLLV